MSNKLANLNQLLAKVIEELNIEMTTPVARDAETYLQLSDLIIKMDNITNLMLSDIPKNNLLN